VHCLHHLLCLRCCLQVQYPMQVQRYWPDGTPSLPFSTMAVTTHPPVAHRLHCCLDLLRHRLTAPSKHHCPLAQLLTFAQSSSCSSSAAIELSLLASQLLLCRLQLLMQRVRGGLVMCKRTQQAWSTGFNLQVEGASHSFTCHVGTSCGLWSCGAVSLRPHTITPCCLLNV
jgi:hypothetical protein